MKADVSGNEDEVFLACLRLHNALRSGYSKCSTPANRREDTEKRFMMSNNNFQTLKDIDPIYTEVSTTLSPPRSPPKHIAKRVRLSSALSHRRGGSEARKARHGRTIAWMWLSVVTKCTTTPGNVDVKLEPVVDHNVVPIMIKTVADPV